MQFHREDRFLRRIRISLQNFHSAKRNRGRLDIQFLILNRQLAGLLVIGEVAFRSGNGHLAVLADTQVDLVDVVVTSRCTFLDDCVALAGRKRRSEVVL